MDFVTSALLGGALYDLVKSKITPTAAYVKAALDSLVNLEDKVAEAIALEISKSEFKRAESKEQLASIIEANAQLTAVIKELNTQPNQVINITANGDGDAFYGDKIIVNNRDVK